MEGWSGLGEVRRGTEIGRWIFLIQRALWIEIRTKRRVYNSLLLTRCCSTSWILNRVSGMHEGKLVPKGLDLSFGSGRTCVW